MRDYGEVEKQILAVGYTQEFWGLFSEVLEDKLASETQAQLNATTIERVMFHKTRREILQEILNLPGKKS